jgi:serine/threonine protein kinase
VKPLAPSDSTAIGQYRAIAELGRGSMGRVLLSAGPDGQLVALKQIHKRLMLDEGFRARFRREVEMSRKVAGNHISGIVDADADATVPWLTSVYVPGPSLQEVVESVGGLAEQALRHLAAGLASALTDIHAVGLVHRDLKPSNILLANDGVRVIDFGIARAIESEGSSQLTHTGWLIGSPGFMSPEQAQGQPVGTASDIFCLGTVLVTACTGHCPFIGQSVPQTLFNIVFQEPDLSSLPPTIRSVAVACLKKEAAARPTAAQLLEIIGPVTGSQHPWPSEVNRLISRQQAEVQRLEQELRTRSTVPQPAPLHIPPSPPAAAPLLPVSWPTPAGSAVPLSRTTRNRSAAVVVGAVAAAALVVGGAIVVAEQVIATEGTSTSISSPNPLPVPTYPTQIVPEPTSLVNPSEAPSSAITEYSPPPSPTTTRDVQQAAIMTCEGGQAVTEPDSLLLACGDGGDGLQNLTWSNWGEPTATAEGDFWVVNCQPDCASGTESVFAASVTVFGLEDGRYTSMELEAPGAPAPYSQTPVELDAGGPLLRGGWHY